MGDSRVITPAQYDVIHKVDSGGIKFKLKVPLPGIGPAVTLIAKHDPSLPLYKIIIARQTKVLNLNAEEREVATYMVDNFGLGESQEFWLSWNNKKLKLGLITDAEPLFVYSIRTDHDIGYVQFNTMSSNWIPVEWTVEVSPVIFDPVTSKTLGNKMRWRPLQNGKLPPGAMIGGFEEEPTYIARANHNNSLCPGKYVPSQNKAYVPWGHREHAKTEFEILCGYNAVWQKIVDGRIPINAFIGGRSEVRNEPLYIGRAVHDGKMITGKIHMLYKTCYLPYNGKEVETKPCEILVIPNDDIPQAIPILGHKKKINVYYEDCDEFNNQFEDWLEDGIEQPNDSDEEEEED